MSETIPTVAGEVCFDKSYEGNPLVNALAVGVMRHEDLKFAKATGVGNKVILYGAATGADGIGGASILASETFDADGPAKRLRVKRAAAVATPEQAITAKSVVSSRIPMFPTWAVKPGGSSMTTH